MIKYQICIHVKNNDLPELIKGEEYDSKIFYHIKFKGIFDNVQCGLNYILDIFSETITKNRIGEMEIRDATHITKIDTVKCHKWEKLFFKTI